MTKAKKILCEIAKQNNAMPFNRLAGSSRTDIRIKTQKKIQKLARQKKKARSQFSGGMINRKTLRKRIQQLGTGKKKSLKKLVNKALKPDYQGNLNIYDLRGNKER